MSEITELIGQARDGNRQASERLFASLYAELKHVARGQLAGGDAPLHATSLVHEAYVKLARGADVAIRDREHFYATAARVMRQIIIDHVRARDAQRRGAGVRPNGLDSGALAVVAEQRGEDVLALEDALERLMQLDPALGRLVELRFYAGLELSEIAALVDRSERSLKRDWRRARAFLYAEIGDADGPLAEPAE